MRLDETRNPENAMLFLHPILYDQAEITGNSKRLFITITYTNFLINISGYSVIKLYKATIYKISTV